MNARKRRHRHGVSGKGERDDTARWANAVRPYGSRFTFSPVGNPQTFRREQAPALRCAVYLFARRDAPPGASGKGRLWHNVAGKGERDDTWVPRRADDICPYSAGVVFAPGRGGYQPPANVAIGTMSPGKANGMIRRCIHSLSLGRWPIQLPRRGSLGYVLFFLALSYLYRHTQKAFPFGRIPCPYTVCKPCVFTGFRRGANNMTAIYYVGGYGEK